MFDDDDVRRLQYILREQRDHFLPLKVIKSKLTAWERGEDGTSPSGEWPAARVVLRLFWGVAEPR